MTGNHLKVDCGHFKTITGHFKIISGHLKMDGTLFEDTSFRRLARDVFTSKRFYDFFYAPVWVTGFIKSPESMEKTLSL